MHLAGPDLLDLPGQRRQRHLHVVRAHVLPGVRRAGEARQGGLPHLQEEDRQRHQDVLELARNQSDKCSSIRGSYLSLWTHLYA